MRLRFFLAAACAVCLTVPAPADAAIRGIGAARNVVALAVARRDVVDFGRAPATTAVRLALTLNYRNEAELEQLVTLQGTPGSPLYHHFLTPAQFADNFAPSEADYQRVVKSLLSAGFRVGPEASNRTIVDAIGSASAAERYFGTQIHRVAQRDHGIRYANVTAATLPAAIAGAVRSVAGIDNVVKFRSQRARAAGDGRSNRTPDRSPLLSGPIERIVDGQFEGLYPTGIAKAYNYPAQTGFTGTGHALAVVIDSDIANSDLTTFWKAAGVTRTGSFTRVLVDGINPGVGEDVGETAIDTEMTTSLAPGANVSLYLIEDLDDQPIEDAYNLAVRSHNLDVVSSSFGGCEAEDLPFSSATNAIALQGASVGITFMASSGDTGGYCDGDFGEDIVNSPASDPEFLAIGGTALTVNPSTGARVSETAWGPGGQMDGSGGGVSSFWAIPSYQAHVAGMAVVPTIVSNPQPNSGFAGRNLPDVSLDASNHPDSYVAVYDTSDGGWTGYGGTSVSCPLFAALVTEVNQERRSLFGFANPEIYAAFTQNGAKPHGVYGSIFFDITSGSTGAGWSAHTGYDQSTGIGSII